MRRARILKLLGVGVFALAAGCMEPPATLFNLSNATRHELLVSSRDRHAPELHELWNVAPGETRALYMYRTGKKTNLALEQGLELKLKTSQCSRSVSNEVLRRETKTDGPGRWVFVVQPAMVEYEGR